MLRVPMTSDKYVVHYDGKAITRRTGRRRAFDLVDRLGEGYSVFNTFTRSTATLKDPVG